MLYRKRPVVIEAMQYTPETWKQVGEFIGSDGWDFGETPGTIAIRTLEGIIIASLYDWVIKGIKGEFYPCKPDVFEKTYEKVEEDLGYHE